MNFEKADFIANQRDNCPAARWRAIIQLTVQVCFIKRKQKERLSAPA
ncbi:hypothetical protein HMPREF0262_02704 [Clostridium sp. ATCC 29733]|nr:hypothetical protein HMPREF0262_02704 [Clostridium sp. ATCC 29733]